MPPIIGKSNGPLQPYWTTADGLSVKLYRGHVLDTLNRLPRRSVHTVITSPPYWGLRDYGTGQWEGGRKDCDHVERMIDLSASTMRGENPVGMHEKKAQVGHQYKSQCGKCGARRIDSQLGSESVPDCLGWARGVNCADNDNGGNWAMGCHVCRMVLVFRSVRRILRDDGTLWLNYGDTYSTSGVCGGSSPVGDRGYRVADKVRQTEVKSGKGNNTGLKSGNLCGIPWRVAFALQADGWILRSDIPWLKRSAMPESTTNRPCKALEYVFLFAKQGGYYFDMEAVRKPSPSSVSQEEYDAIKGNGTWQSGGKTMHAGSKKDAPRKGHPNGRAFRNADLWFESVKSPHGLTGVGDELVGIDCTSEAYPGAHYATFPSKLITPFILVGTSEYGCCANCGTPWRRAKVATGVKGVNNEVIHTDKSMGDPGNGGDARVRRLSGATYQHTTKVTDDWEQACSCDTEEVVPCTVMDPFIGSGTTASVALEHGRYAIGIELKEEYLRKNAIPRIEGVCFAKPELRHLVKREVKRVDLKGKKA